MSVISSLLLFILCVSFQSCYGRHLGALRKEPETNSPLPSKINDEITSTLGAAGAEALVNQVSRVDKEVHKPWSSSQKANENTAASGDVEPDQPRPSDHPSMQEPGPKIRDEEQPGYNLDYPCPRTHPPAHN